MRSRELAAGILPGRDASRPQCYVPRAGSAIDDGLPAIGYCDSPGGSRRSGFVRHCAVQNSLCREPPDLRDEPLWCGECPAPDISQGTWPAPAACEHPLPIICALTEKDNLATAPGKEGRRYVAMRWLEFAPSFHCRPRSRRG